VPRVLRGIAQGAIVEGWYHKGYDYKTWLIPLNECEVVVTMFSPAQRGSAEPVLFCNFLSFRGRACWLQERLKRFLSVD
jgi:hypothetical protein